MLLLVLLLLGKPVIANDDGCNELVCASVVSKCLLTQSCQCKLNDCHCCKDCLNCLGELYTECCGCLDMCPKHKDTISALSPRSQIGDIVSIPELFNTLTAENDDQWFTIRILMRPGPNQRIGSGPDLIKRPWHEPIASVNCTIVYVNTCIRPSKCKQQCESMGANSYRWFHDGCCECVGDNCLNYGINESRCSACPEDHLFTTDSSNVSTNQDLENIFGFDDDEHNDMWDYAEEDDIM